MRFYHSLVMPTNRLQNKSQLDMWKGNESLSRQPRVDGKRDGQISMCHKDGLVRINLLILKVALLSTGKCVYS
jgi:hypothetical protein